ncbi:MAG TPA: alpha/beta hydrolase [Devosiaceae bacterium]|jgi:acetyl esterase/lipase
MIASRFARAIGAALVLMVLMASHAMALGIMDPFNVPAAMDGGTSKVGDNIAYADGPRHKLDIYAPEQRGAPAPVIFFIYGGGWNRGEKADYQFVGRAFAARGFITVIADYRLVPEVHFPEFLEDNASALKWVQDHIAEYGGDTKRLFLAGHSAGAYNAVMLALDPSYFKEYGVTMAIRGVAALSGPYDFYPFEYNEVRDAFGNAASPEGTQPVNLVTNDVPPMLLTSGTYDPIVRMQNSENLAKLLKAQGDWVTTKYYDGFGHMEPVIALGALWRWRMPILNDVVEFFSTFGAFPSGVPRVAVAPAAPEGVLADGQPIQPMAKIVDQLDQQFAPISNQP